MRTIGLEDIVVVVPEDEVEALLDTEDRFYRECRRREAKGGKLEYFDTAMGAYRHEASGLDVIGQEGLTDLFKRYQAGMMAEYRLQQGTSEDEERDERLSRMGVVAKQHIVLGNLRLVYHMMKKYQNKALSYEDSVHAGNTGLIRAVEKFDYTRGIRFSTYAAFWIRQTLTRAQTHEGRMIGISDHIGAMERRIRKARYEIEKVRDDYTVEELAEAANVPLDIARALLGTETVDTLDRRVAAPDGYEGSRLGEMIEDKNSPQPFSGTEGLEEEVEALIVGLTHREKFIIRHRFGLGGYEEMTAKQISKELGVSDTTVHNDYVKAMRKLSRNRNLAKFVDYLGDDADAVLDAMERDEEE